MFLLSLSINFLIKIVWQSPGTGAIDAREKVSKLLERNVVYIPIITSSHATSLTSKYYISNAILSYF